VERATKRFLLAAMVVVAAALVAMGANGIYKTSPTDHNGDAVESLQMLVIDKGMFTLVTR
jgi:hypothetical protein